MPGDPIDEEWNRVAAGEPQDERLGIDGDLAPERADGQQAQQGHQEQIDRLRTSPRGAAEAALHDVGAEQDRQCQAVERQVYRSYGEVGEVIAETGRDEQVAQASAGQRSAQEEDRDPDDRDQGGDGVNGRHNAPEVED